MLWAYLRTNRVKNRSKRLNKELSDNCWSPSMRQPLENSLKKSFMTSTAELSPNKLANFTLIYAPCTNTMFPRGLEQFHEYLVFDLLNTNRNFFAPLEKNSSIFEKSLYGRCSLQSAAHTCSSTCIPTSLYQRP